MLFLKDEQCCHAPYLMFRRYYSTKMVNFKKFSHVLIVRPDSNFECAKLAHSLNSDWKNRGIYHGYSFTRQKTENNSCPVSIQDQWMYGDSLSIVSFLNAFPKLKTWHKEWEQDHKWWEHGNILQPGKFFLNTEGVHGKLLQKLNATCHPVETDPFFLNKRC